MTNEEAKQAAIIKAWGVAYNPHIDRSGWFDLKFSDDVPLLIDFMRSNPCDGLGNEIRPMSLNGIEDNNGWTRIKPDGSNLPEKDFSLYEMSIDGRNSCGVYTGMDINIRWQRQKNKIKYRITHIKKWKPSNSPIY